MSRNIIDAIVTLVNDATISVAEETGGSNRINNQGDGLENYVKDLFADALTCNPKERKEKRSEVFSYLGNKNNPPDAMLKQSDAIEIKKVQAIRGRLELNSSHPHETLRSDSPLITKACKDAETWDEKDMLYIIGTIPKKSSKLKALCMVYGKMYAAEEGCYLGVKDSIKYYIDSLPNVTLDETKELGKIKKIDPLEITTLRIRGMWEIDNPWTVFEEEFKYDDSKEFSFRALIESQRWESFNNTQLLISLQEENEHLNIKDVKVEDPNNPANLIDAKLVTFEY